MEYSADTADKIRQTLQAYKIGFIDYKELYEDIESLLNFDSFCTEQQNRIDLGLQPTIHTKQLIQVFEQYLKEDANRFGRMDIDKGLVNDLDRLHLELKRWVNTFTEYHKNPVKIKQEELPIKGFISVYERAKNLINGNDVQVGYDEWTTQTDTDKELKGWLMLERLYNKIKPFANSIKQMAEQEKENKFCIDHPYTILVEAIKLYENEGRFILDAERELKEKTNKEPQQVALQTAPIQQPILPNELHTDRAVKSLAKAVEMGYIEQTETGYKRIISKALLAYFLEWVFCKDESGKDNGQPFPETALNKLFNETRLRAALTQTVNNHNGDGKPKRYEKIDAIFK